MMDIAKLRYVAESLQTALLEGVAISDIHDFDINIIADDNKIEVWVVEVIPLKHLKITVKVKRV